MQPPMNLVKAAQRSVPRAEVNLIIVVVVLSSWSVYAIYKLSQDERARSVRARFDDKQEDRFEWRPAAQPNGTRIIAEQPDKGPTVATVPASQLPDNNNSMLDTADIIAQYKKQILKELTERRNTLLGEGDSSPSDRLDNQQPESNRREQSRASLDQDGHQHSAVGWNEASAARRRSGLPLDASRLQQAVNTTRQLSIAPDQNLKTLIRRRQTLDKHRKRADLATRAPPSQSDAGPRKEEDASIDTDEAPLWMGAETTTGPSVGQLQDNPSESDDSRHSPAAEEDGVPTTGGLGHAPGSEASDAGDDTSDLEAADEDALRRVKGTVHSIDEEVDRMTQPSLGVASRRHYQDEPTELFGSTVQFDDTLGDSANAARRTQVQQAQAQRQLVAGGRRHKSTKPVEDQEDLLVEHGDGRAPWVLDDDLSGGAKKKKKKLRRNRVENRRRREKRSFGANSLNLVGNQEKNLERDDEDDGVGGGGGGESKPSNGTRNLGDILATSKPLDESASLEELLAHKQLLDALEQSRLPAPVPVPDTERGHRLSGAGVTTPTPGGRPLNQPANGVDHQPLEDAQFSFDATFPLDAAADQDHEQQSKPHAKRAKSAERKSDKKVTVGTKKGGHKKKKHRKETKRIHKERKFGGIQKGKKAKKGRGGRGGKKGSKLYKDKGFKKKGFKNIYVKNEFGQKKSYFDEFRDKDFKKKWRNFDDKYNYAQLRKWQGKELKRAKKMKDHGEKMKSYDKGKWKKKYQAEKKSKSKMKDDDFD